MLKVLTTLVVVGVLAFTVMLAWHVAVSPVEAFEKVIPDPTGKGRKEEAGQIARVLETPKTVEVDPGERPYQRASELLALGKVGEARERMTALVNSFPTSESARKARKILGEMNLDELLSAQMTEGKQVHPVVRGDGYLAIAVKYQTTLENMMHLNSMLEMRGLRPGDELLVMPLNFRVLIEPRRSALSLWDGGRFVCEYPLRKVPGTALSTTRATEVESKSAEAEEGGRVLPGTAGYAAATKVITLKQPVLRIQGWDGVGVEPSGALLLDQADMEELNLLVRKGNVVEFR